MSGGLQMHQHDRSHLIMLIMIMLIMLRTFNLILGDFDRQHDRQRINRLYPHQHLLEWRCLGIASIAGLPLVEGFGYMR